MSLSNRQLKYLSSLSQKKYRQKHRQCLVEGLRLCEEAIPSDWPLRELYVTEDFANQTNADRVLGMAGEKHLSPVTVSTADMERITDTRNSQGIAVLADLPEPQIFHPDPNSHPQVLLLDGISDPGNLGTLLRSADWFGVREMVLGPGSVEWSNPKVMRASMGAVFRITAYDITSWNDVFEQLHGANFSIVTADMNGQALTEFSPTLPWALLLGNEAHGISAKLAKQSDIAVTIPGSGPADSLNVAMAGTVLLYELTSSVNF